MMNGTQQIVGGLLAYCFSLIGNDHDVKSFQALFMTYGCASVLWGFFVLWWLPDSPMRAKCFSEEDKRLMVERVRSNQTGIQNKKFRAYQIKEALLDPQVWCYCAIQIFTTLPTSGLGAFANIIIEGFDFTVLQTQLLAMVLGFYIIIVLLTSAWLVRKTGQNLYVMLGFIIPYVSPTLYFYLRNPNAVQLVRRHNRPHDCRKPQHGHQGRSPDQLLHYPFLLVRADPRAINGISQHRWRNQEIRSHRRDIRLVGCGQCHRPASVPGP